MSHDHATLAARDVAHLIHPVTSPRELAQHGPRIVVEADGWMLTDDRGNRIIDGFAGLWCVTAGHGRREIIDAVRAQMETLEYFTTFHGQSHPVAIELAERIAAMFPPAYGLEHVMFASGGSEANETLFKIVRLYWALRGRPTKKTIVSRHHGYHGLTLATMAATGIMPMHWNFDPEPAGFTHVPAPYCYKCELGLTYPSCDLACARAIETLIEDRGADTIGAVVAEPVIGAGGIIPPPTEYFPMVRDICDRHDLLLIMDEVVCGFGRTGTMFGFQHWDVRPDMVTLAKGLTSGYLPLGASVVSDAVWSTIEAELPDQMPFSHGFTYMGHPACCAAALANLAIIEREDLPGNAARVGAHLMRRMQELERYESVGEVRGMGLMIGIELVTDKATRRGFSTPHAACTRVEHAAWDRGLYCRAMGIDVVGLAPPLTIDVATADRMVDILAQSIEVMEAELLPRERTLAAQRPAERVATPRAFFEDVLPARIDAEHAAGIDVVVQFALDGPDGGIWLLTVRHGRAAIEPLDHESATAACTIRAAAADFVRVVNGDLSGAEAFSAQRLRVEGDLGAAASLMALGVM